MNIEKELLDLYADPLFVNIKVPPRALTANDRMSEKLLAINDFVRKTGCEPQSQGTFEEKKLARSLQALRDNKNETLVALDEFNLL